jgi:mRNA-degrading endonuclease RelE of RelBE toxin-antitoxin system
MSDKTKKFLAKLSAKELARVRAALQHIALGELETLDVKALKGKPGYIRIRAGRVRIICKQVHDGYEVLHITNRNEKTYKGL